MYLLYLRNTVGWQTREEVDCLSNCSISSYTSSIDPCCARAAPSCNMISSYNGLTAFILTTLAASLHAITLKLACLYMTGAYFTHGAGSFVVAIGNQRLQGE